MGYYDREAAVRYAREWALMRNPRYLDFEHLGGDCTNFTSQCLYAGCQEMDYTPVLGWFYITASNRTASWTGVRYLYEFLMRPHLRGVHARLADRQEIRPGDIVQLGRADGSFYHSPFVVAVAAGEVLVAAHSQDAWMRPLSSYSAQRTRFLRVLDAW